MIENTATAPPAVTAPAASTDPATSVARPANPAIAAVTPEAAATSAAAADMAVGRSTVRPRILGLLMASDDTRLHLREIQRRAGTSPGTASRELNRLLTAGLVERETEGHQVYFRVTSSPFATMLRTLLIVPEADTFLPAARRPTGGRTVTPPGSRLVAAGSPPDGTIPSLTAPRSDDSGPRLIQAKPSATAPPLPPPPPDELALGAARRLAEAFAPVYGERLRGVYLLGPRAAGNPPADADIEVAVILDAVERYGDELERTSSFCASLSLELGLVVSRVFISAMDWGGRSDGLLPLLRPSAVGV
jgi:predicted nucleotidyltransferase